MTSLFHFFSYALIHDSNQRNLFDDMLVKVKTSPLDDDNIKRMQNYYHHNLLPLFWCNNKEVERYIDCNACTSYYYCHSCERKFYKECVESPLEINYPSHAKHSLQLYFSNQRSDHCFYCRERAGNLVYYCALCETFMHPLCAQAAIPFFIDHPKRHDHTLTLFPRLASLSCNLCALVNKLHFTYACSICNFLVHNDCLNIPQTIRISRHHHHVSFAFSLPLGKWSCGVCRQEVDSDYGTYTCNVCSRYAVHTRCALRTDIWDGKKLEGVPEEDVDVEPPFQRISDGIILHFSHGCHLILEAGGVYDENKFCQACTLSVNEESFYFCVECDFILHERCAYTPRQKVHPLHPHPLTQKATPTKVVWKHPHPLRQNYNFTTLKSGFYCHACNRLSNGFRYECTMKDCDYLLDVVFASVSEPFDCKGHLHPLFLALDPKEKPMCDIFKSTEVNTVRYKHDKHYLTFCRGDEASGSDWCELCEGKLAIIGPRFIFIACLAQIHILSLV